MSATAPGKAILFGEHAVVYGRPAIAVPIHALQATAELSADRSIESGKLWIDAPDIGFSGMVAYAGGAGSGGAIKTAEGAGSNGDAAEQPTESPVAGLALAVEHALGHFRPAERTAGDALSPGLRLELRSNIPVAAGMGSSAAVAVAVLRATAEHLGQEPTAEVVAELAFAVERHYHGAPSGIDNTVVAYGEPIYFVKGKRPTPLPVGAPMVLILADSGVAAPTRQLVDGVRERWEADRPSYEKLFDQIAAVVDRARRAIETAQTDELGPLMAENQQLLAQLGVSTPQLELLIAAALEAGAQGAKLSGAGGGGLVLALATAESAQAIQEAVLRAGAARALTTQVGS